MIRRMATAAMFAGLMLGAYDVPAQTSTTKTTNTYKASSTSEDIRISCKELSVNSQATLSAKCNKTLDDGTVDAVSTTIDIPTYANCNHHKGYRINWGAPIAGRTLVGPFTIVVTSTGDTYFFLGYCQGGGKTILSGIDIGDTTNGFKNDAGSLAKR